MLADGPDAAETRTVTLLKSVPPGPVQFRLYTLVPVSTPVDSEPETAFPPDQSPLAVHAVAFVVDHVSVALVFHGIVHVPTEPLQRNVSTGVDGAFTVITARDSAGGAAPRSTMTLPAYVPAALYVCEMAD